MNRTTYHIPWFFGKTAYESNSLWMVKTLPDNPFLLWGNPLPVGLHELAHFVDPPQFDIQVSFWDPFPLGVWVDVAVVVVCNHAPRYQGLEHLNAVIW